LASQPSTPTVRLQGLVKNYGETSVLRGIDVEIPVGQIAVLLGSNGAGKTTLLRILSMLTQPDAGTVQIYGFDTSTSGPSVRAVIGAALHSPMLYADMSIRENLEFFAGLYRLESISELIEQTAIKVGISERLDQRVRTLSHGYQKRVALARSLMHNPSLLILDEPDSGLDSLSVGMLDTIIDEHRASGKTVLFTTHLLDHALAIADRAVVLDRGKVLIDSTDPESERDSILDAYARQQSLSGATDA
jgi:heme exporter protein A